MKNHFIQHLLARHVDLDQNVKPRVRGMYEAELDLVPSLRERDSNEGEDERRVPELPGVESVSPTKQTRSSAAEQKNSSEALLQKPTASTFLTHRLAQPTAAHEQRLERIEPAEKKTHSTAGELNVHDEQKSLPDERREGVWPVRFNTKIYVTKSADVKNDGGEHQNSPDHDTQQDFARRQPERDVSSTTKADVTPVPYTPLTVAAKRHDFKNALARPTISSQSGIAAPQVINITIGRVEVRAATPTLETKTAMPKEHKASMSLEQYLDQKKSANR